MTALANTSRTDDLLLPRVHPDRFAVEASAVSWGAILAGAAAAAALSLILLILGTGLGLSSVSPWAQTGVTAATFGVGTILWIAFTQLAASGMGGYLAGRLRTKWLAVHTDEVYFRDTAHGFLAWAVALVITAALLAAAAASMVGATASSAAGGTGRATGVQAEGREFDPNEYLIDTLFRSESAKPDSNSTSVRGEAGRIFANALRQGAVSAPDRSYLAQLVAARTGLGQPDADKRISDVFAAAQQTADTARKAVAHSLLWAFLALLIGAFCASFAATVGGRQRDHVVVV